MPPPDRSRREPPVPGDKTVLPDDAVLAELTAPVALEDARESLAFWRRRVDELPRHKRAERREAQDAIERWETNVREAERAQYGPSLLEQVLGAVGVRWRPRPRRLVAGLGAVAVVLLLLLVALVAAIVAFWPEIEPIVRTLLNSGGEGGGGG